MPRYKDETTITNHSTGEMVTTSKSFTVRVKDSDEFFMMFVQVMAPMVKLKNSGTDIAVLVALCTFMTYGENVVYLTQQRRKEICDKSEISTSNLSRSLKKLTELGLISGEGGNVFVNPLFFWKGTTDSRNRLLKDRGLEFKIKFGGPEDE